MVVVLAAVVVLSLLLLLLLLLFQVFLLLPQLLSSLLLLLLVAVAGWCNCCLLLVLLLSVHCFSMLFGVVFFYYILDFCLYCFEATVALITANVCCKSMFGKQKQSPTDAHKSASLVFVAGS